MNSYRIIKTGLPLTYERMFEAIMGQLSKGIWEHSSSMRSYYLSCRLDVIGNEVVIHVINNDYVFDSYWNRFRKNPYYEVSDSTIKKFFANKIRTIVQYEAEDMDAKYLYRFSEGNKQQCWYLDKTSVDNAVKAYKILNS